MKTFHSLFSGWLLLLPFACCSIAYGVEPDGVYPFFRKYCWDCHSADTHTALDFEQLGRDLTSPADVEVWVKIFDKIQNREMPPAGAEKPNPVLLANTLDRLGRELVSANVKQYQKNGRVPARRLTKTEYRYTIQDLMHIDIDVTTHIPDETASGGFDTNGRTQRISSVHMQGLMRSADDALQEALDKGLEVSPYQQFKYDILNSPRLAYHDGKTFIDGGGIYRRIGDGLVIFTDVDFLLPSHAHHFEVKRAGIYQITIDASAYQSDVPLTLKLINKGPNGGGRMLAVADIAVEPIEPLSVVAFLRPGDSFYPTYAVEDNVQGGGIDFLMKHGDMDYQGKGIHIRSIRIDGPLNQEWPPRSATQLLPGVEVTENRTPEGRQRYEVNLQTSIEQHVEDSLRVFSARAFRRPVGKDELQSFVELALPAIEKGENLQESLKVPMRAILSSPQFLIFHEVPGRLDSYALANRLSYFLWRSMPDSELVQLAKSGKLLQEEVLRQQVERMLADVKSRRFIKDFLGQWLMLNKINANTPDQRLFWEYDEVLADALLRETELFYQHLLEGNLSAVNFIDSDFTFVNRRLAQHYGLPDVTGQQMRRVSLPPDSPRGGFLAQASILKTTANGTSTSPVVRGNFVLTNFYGTPAPSPPPSVGSVEPDIRGKTTIREILSAHRDVATCNACHRKIDPPGFALESFDPIGRYRNRYRIKVGDEIREELVVDASGITPEGHTFRSFKEFKQLMLADKDIIIGNYIMKLLEFSTGSEIQFADRQEVGEIIARSKINDYRVRDIVVEIVLSDVFRKK